MAVLLNPSERTRVLEVHIQFAVDSDGLFNIRLDAPDLVWLTPDGQRVPWSDSIKMERPPHTPRENRADGRPVEARAYERWCSYRVEVPPGRHVITFRCTPPPGFLPHDHRPVYYFVKDFAVVEPGVGPQQPPPHVGWRER
jgi:hypothetical protein